MEHNSGFTDHYPHSRLYWKPHGFMTETFLGLANTQLVVWNL